MSRLRGQIQQFFLLLLKYHLIPELHVVQVVYFHEMDNGKWQMAVRFWLQQAQFPCLSNSLDPGIHIEFEVDVLYVRFDRV